jgi:hypothetical protein
MSMIFGVYSMDGKVVETSILSTMMSALHTGVLGAEHATGQPRREQDAATAYPSKGPPFNCAQQGLTRSRAL